ncbi:transcriptional regulator GntR family [Clostridium aceticum]|uniref:Transcriptional regulator GntR family n=1 Tax=Clostridium aceticum TaxID=84022 RepID=A0A0D8IAL5_9CLOT|nr:GntR family transcriptional regulator [Clostridium aceticum]AKL97237.1 transcriptional regulator GntR family [Clostridium aceticum]KJF26266.1 GntR family transcriptional regulator [Clostridium aceticum]
MLVKTADYQKENLCSIVVDYIREMILCGVYKEGDHILETEVAKNLGISRAPVREGIKELQNEGIVTVIPRKGTYITKFTLEDIKEVFDIRLLLENNILEILISENKLSEEDFLTLENIVSSMIQVVNGPEDIEKKAMIINMKDMEFHRFIWKKSGSSRRVEILEGIFFQLRMAMLYDTNETGNLLVTATDHYEIIKHLRSKDLERCKKALREHIVSYKDGRF